MSSCRSTTRIDLDALVKDELEVSTITLYQSDPEMHRGSLIAVNAEYICYAIKGARSRGARPSALLLAISAARRRWQRASSAAGVALAPHARSPAVRPRFSPRLRAPRACPG
jgi:hypothetical protein